MWRFSVILLCCTLAAAPLMAQNVGNGQVLVLPLTTELATDEMARVLTSTGRSSECLAPVEVTRIDGELRTVSARGFFIEAGVHSLNGKAALDLTNCPLSSNKLYIDNVADLEVDFEAGGTYYIAYYHAPANPEEWKLVVWHIEKSP